MEAAGALQAYSGVSQRRAIKPERVPAVKKARPDLSRVKALAEGIILQAIEDLADAGHRKESLRFFMGEEFDVWSGIARLNRVQQIQLVRLIAGVARQKTGTRNY